MQEIIKNIGGDMALGVLILAVGIWWGLDNISDGIEKIGEAYEGWAEDYKRWVDEQIRVSQLKCPEFEDETITLEEVIDALREEGAPPDHVALDRIQSVVDKIESERSE